MRLPRPMAHDDFTRAMLADLRENGRVTAGPLIGRPMLILTSIGAKTGRRHEAIVNYTRDGDRYVIAASKGAAPTNPAWYHNLRAHPEATAEVERETFRVRASVATGEERDRLWEQHATAMPFFREYPGRTKRVIPMIVLERLD